MLLSVVCFSYCFNIIKITILTGNWIYLFRGMKMLIEWNPKLYEMHILLLDRINETEMILLTGSRITCEPRVPLIGEQFILESFGSRHQFSVPLNDRLTKNCIYRSFFIYLNLKKALLKLINIWSLKILKILFFLKNVNY